jgi:transcriptional regulator with XRE-family HTH domain
MAVEDEIVQGELLPSAPSATPIPGLSSQQYQAALMESAGASRPQIASVIGVSQSTIKNWRSRDAYVAEVERLKSIAVGATSEAVTKLREELVDGMRDAVKTLRGNLEATDGRGKPIYGVRRDAAELLLKQGVELLRDESDAKNKAAGGTGQPVQAIQINVNTEQGPPPERVE